ncbi:hypothetical protein P691DRAFT_214834 [Macrolepiota fuliginosa MF-IS2]|uniref:Uncharacterized protein n=1 Tax=Macrolepiota fuliginosa MF-IS2 TaxID=1400762 RepID=A0A9P5XAF8_9AGAR|nr:hypothetical protein P691DRAFT_214834 [Macrolepiota fuliginosa MF-IS2]
MSDKQLLLWEDLNLITPTTINGVLYGIAMSLYVLSARSFYPQFKDPHQWRHATFMFVYTSVMLFSGIAVLALSTQEIQLSYIKHNTFLGEPVTFDQFYVPRQPDGIANNVFGIIVDFLTAGIQIWRLWIIYNATRHATTIIVLPVLLFLCLVVMDIVCTLPLSNSDVPAVAIRLAMTSQLVITVFVTISVISRLLYIRRRHIKLMGATDISKQYVSIVAMLIESYVLESVWILMLLLSYFLDNIAMFTLLINCDAIEVIAYLLVIYRVSTGGGWSKQTEGQISSLYFREERDTHTVGLEVATQTSQALPGANMVTLSPDHSAV